MNMIDAVVVALVGMGVVFFGLILTSLTIWSFSVVPPLLKKLRPIKETPAAEQAQQGAGTTPGPSPVPEADVLAVIATVLEVERRLNYSERMSRFTFRNR